MRIALTLLLSVVLVSVPIFLSKQLETEPLYFENVVFVLLCYYAGVLYLILKSSIVKRRLILTVNVLPIIGVIVGYILHQVYKANCGFTEAIIDRSGVCNLIFVSEKFIYSAIYSGGIILVADIVLVIRFFFKKKEF